MPLWPEIVGRILFGDRLIEDFMKGGQKITCPCQELLTDP